MAEILTSEWGNLNSNLLAEFYEVDRTGKRVPDGVVVRAPLSDSSLDITQNWQSPFENVAQSTWPTVQQLLQSAAGAPLAERVDDKLGTELKKLISSIGGKSSVTKLNSVQVWSGAPPASLTVTAVFRAWKDSKREVEDPVNQLMQWALPVYLADDGLLLSRLTDFNSDSNAFLPSIVPSILAFKYKNRVYSPVVIESITLPIGSSIDTDGQFVELSIPIKLATLTSIDRGDWRNFSY